MSVSKVFIQFEDNDSYISNVLDLIVQSLEANADRMKTEEIRQLGEGFESVTRPWALVFLKDDSHLEAELSKRVKNEAKERLWLDLIQPDRHISSVTRHSLCVTCKNKEIRNHEPKQLSILEWIENEKDGQPPSLIVVVDLLELLAEGKKDYSKLQYMTISNNELSTILATLVESCVFESTIKTDDWELGLGVKMHYLTELVITDKAFLPPLKDTESRDKFQNDTVESLHKILHYYLDHLYDNTTEKQ